MKVKELIARLEKCDPEKLVVMGGEWDNPAVDVIGISEDEFNNHLVNKNCSAKARQPVIYIEGAMV